MCMCTRMNACRRITTVDFLQFGIFWGEGMEGQIRGVGNTKKLPLRGKV